MLEKSNTWPEQVLDTLNSCWRALLESVSNTQANVRHQALPGTGAAALATRRHCFQRYQYVRAYKHGLRAPARYALRRRAPLQGPPPCLAAQ